MARILVADDDIFILQFIDKILHSSEYETILVQNGEEALRKYYECAPDLVLLDVMMPKKNGLDVCREIREQNALIPILLLTAKQQIENKVAGLESGADDYITNPFDRHELLARIQSALRRQQAIEGKQESPSPEKVSIDLLDLYLNTWQAEYNHTPIKLSRTEFKLLRVFCENPDTVIERQYLLNHVWDYEENSSTRTVDNFIMRVRKKLQTLVQAQGESFPNLETLYGIGYRLNSSQGAGWHAEP